MKRREFLKSSTAFAALLSTPISYSHGLFTGNLPSDITDLSASDLSVAIGAKQISCFEVMQAYLSRIERYNPVYNAIVSMVDHDELLKQAKKADEALSKGEYWGWMHGMPHAIKDLAPVKGLPFTSGSPMFANRIAEEDGSLVTKIRNQGAIFIGKTNTPEFGLGSQCYNPVFGATGSAYNPKLTSGGSSGGAACGLGTHMLPAADGGDMMGSLRNPGAFNNVIGFRPSTTVVMEEGDAKDRLLWTSGPMGRDTRDTIRLLQTMAIDPVFDNLNALDLTKIKMGWMGNLDNYLAMEPGIVELCESSLTKVSDAGAKIDSIKPNFILSDLWQSWITLRHSGRTSMMEYYVNPVHRKLLKPELIWEIEQSLVLSEADISNAKRIRKDWNNTLDSLFEKYDFLVLPTAQVFPYSKEIHWPKEINGRAMDTYHRWMEVVILGSLGGIPVVNVPVGFDVKGRPMGMQIMGKFGDDKRVLEFALAYERITNHLNRRPKLIASSK
ncbi:amidase [Maribacter algarum]|uniref:Amidase n=1 Tax=Maribacter algarum (ex Zhang et al. 2020) TaxID=2578118 RepID=A0A5S3PGF3_9FLAO|nr:amidase [Maribacter algarum]TMM53167.1 amidase [Maribacter algarum]